MSFLRQKYIVVCCFIALLLYNCIEAIESGSISYENTLVVEARITNEDKHHTIKLSQTYQIDSIKKVAVPEEKAIVSLIDNNNYNYIFLEKEPGVYMSENVFSAQDNNSYVLNIKRSDGREYESNSESLTNKSEITTLDYDVVNNQETVSYTHLTLPTTSRV